MLSYLEKTFCLKQVKGYKCALSTWDKVKKMRDLDPSDIDQLVALHGMIIRSSNVIPDLKAALFQCALCNNVEEVVLDRGIINEPKTCASCGTSMSMQLIHNRSLSRTSNTSSCKSRQRTYLKARRPTLLPFLRMMN